VSGVVPGEAQLRAIIREELEAALRRDPGDWMTADAVAAMLDVERTTIPTLVTRDGLPAYRPGRKGYVFRRSEVVAWLKGRAVHRGSHGRRHGGTLRAIRGGQDG
jgi:excisionase family DNA binding protein